MVFGTPKYHSHLNLCTNELVYIFFALLFPPKILYIGNIFLYQPLQVGAYSVSGKYETENYIFGFKTLSKCVFSTFSIFPTGSLAYFYGIFDQKLISSIFSDIFDFKVEGFDQKVVAVICRGLVGAQLTAGDWS